MRIRFARILPSILLLSMFFGLNAHAQELTALAEKGDPEAQFALGVMCIFKKDYVEAVKWYRKAANQGHPDAQSALGAMLYRGQGVPQDYAEAVKWFRKSADQGFANGQMGLGIAYSYGQGVPQDYAEGVKWYRKAADQGLATAQNFLGCAYSLVSVAKLISYCIDSP